MPRPGHSHMLPGVLRAGQPFNRAFTIFDDFGGETPVATTAATAQLWDLITLNAGALQAGHAGVMRLTFTGTTQGGIGTSVANIRPTKDRRIIFETRLAINDISAQTDMFVGLGNNTDAPITAGNLDDYIGFFFSTANAVWSAGICKNGSAGKQGAKTAADASTDGETDVSLAGTASAADETYVVLRFEVIGLDHVKFYVDGVESATISSIQDASFNYQNFPDDVDLRAMVFGTAAASDTLDIDYILCTADR